MISFKSNFFTAVEVLSNFFLLNLLWLFMCLPIVTIFPATAAMFGVVREWILKKDTGIYQTFFRCFKENFRQSFLLGLIWIIFLGLLYMNFITITQLDSTGKMILIPMVVLVGILLLLVSVFIFPVMVHFQLHWNMILKNSLILSMSHLPAAFLAILILILMGAMFIWLPATLLFLFSVGTYCIFFICNQVFQKITLNR
ncbi:DUF624 domain-containing protein [Domibacillus sp. A3M-37]|uniref:YesL family protein n=1 Tax=Domibacillus sp. A3M-37 TaxID=2962037 RepID=UPI0020B663E3|nr:DUF624 domain-containing protein [Domibacillus sp. A3M-37]MCP3764821.1 DUF624 domain-containing protein [Domibacillus sp. A3M-37]